MNNEGILGAVVGAAIAVGAGLLWVSVKNDGGTQPSPEPSIKEPQLCSESATSAKTVSLVKIGLDKDDNGNDIVRVAHAGEKCRLANGSVVTWSSDIALTDVRIIFVASIAEKCGSHNSGRSISTKAEEFTAGKLGGIVTPIAVTADTSEKGDFYYCVQANGSLWTPNPAIIIKPD